VDAQKKLEAELEVLYRLIKEAYSHIENKDIANAQTSWIEIKESYGLLPEKVRKKLKHFIDDIENEFARLKEVDAPLSATQEEIGYKPLPSNNLNDFVLSFSKNKGHAQRVQIQEKLEVKPINVPLIGPEPTIPSKTPIVKEKKIEIKKQTPAKKPTYQDLLEIIAASKELLRIKKVQDSYDAYKLAVLLKRKVTIPKSDVNRIRYDLMDIEIGLKIENI
jgi:hypothetical protein